MDILHNVLWSPIPISFRSTLWPDGFTVTCFTPGSTQNVHQEYFLPFTLCSSPSRSIDGFWALPRPSSFSSAFCLVFLMWSLFALGSYKYFRLFLYIFDLKNRVRISALHFSWYLSMVCRMKRVNAELGKHLLIRHLVFFILPKHFVVLNLFRVTFKLENNWNFVF